MVIIKLKKIKKFDYKIALIGLLGNAPARGYTVNDIRQAVEAIKLIRNAKEEVKLEDAIFEFVKKSVNESLYKFAAPELLELINDVNNAKKLEEKKC